MPLKIFSKMDGISLCLTAGAGTIEKTESPGAIKREIESAVGDLVIGIERLGSTSVEGLSAKSCIDIDVVIEDYGVFGEVVRRPAWSGFATGICVQIDEQRADPTGAALRLYSPAT